MIWKAFISDEVFEEEKNAWWEELKTKGAEAVRVKQMERIKNNEAYLRDLNFDFFGVLME